MTLQATETNTGTAIVPMDQSGRNLPDIGTAFSGSSAFESAQRMAKLLSQSRMVPQQYQNNLPDALVALEISQRTGSSPLMVMQNMHVIHGRPSWSSQFVIAALNSCGRFQPLQYRVEGEGDGRVCVAWTRDRHGNVLEGPPVSIQMAKDEGWYGKNGSKWKTMPELMLRYRAAKFFGNLYAPDVLMGMQTAEEVNEIEPLASDIVQSTPHQAAVDHVGALAPPATNAAGETTASANPGPTDGVPLISADGEVVQEYRRIGDLLNALEKLAEQGDAAQVIAANADTLDRIAAEKPKAAERIAEIRQRFTQHPASAAPHPAADAAASEQTISAEQADAADGPPADTSSPAGAGANPDSSNDDFF
ncbi:hypothetical protein [Fodinicurvata sp. EGI_FJ10296]|uniref:hypothetical protein n=1 Tax=Fodinicurvata sp. EGI_FJ10296 TaxID=3231908 RepID=UPI0034570C06